MIIWDSANFHSERAVLPAGSKGSLSPITKQSRKACICVLRGTTAWLKRGALPIRMEPSDGGMSCIWLVEAGYALAGRPARSVPLIRLGTTQLPL